MKFAVSRYWILRGIDWKPTVMLRKPPDVVVAWDLCIWWLGFQWHWRSERRADQVKAE